MFVVESKLSSRAKNWDGILFEVSLGSFCVWYSVTWTGLMPLVNRHAHHILYSLCSVQLIRKSNLSSLSKSKCFSSTKGKFVNLIVHYFYFCIEWIHYSQMWINLESLFALKRLLSIRRFLFARTFSLFRRERICRRGRPVGFRM